jgi:hypothetical protein
MQNYSDRYFCGYFINSKKINDANIIFNFCSLINDTALKSKDSIFLHIKLQWYIDALKFPMIEKIGVKEIDELRNLVSIYNLDINDFILYIQSKLIDLDTFPFKSVEDVLSYAKNTEGVIWQNIARINSVYITETVEEAIDKISQSYCILGLVRNFIYFYNVKNTYILLFNYNETSKDIDLIIQNRVKELLQIANNLIKQSNLLLQNEHKSVKKFLLLNEFTKNYIKNFHKVDSQVLKADFFNISRFTFLKILIKHLFTR